MYNYTNHKRHVQLNILIKQCMFEEYNYKDMFETFERMDSFNGNNIIRIKLLPVFIKHLNCTVQTIVQGIYERKTIKFYQIKSYNVKDLKTEIDDIHKANNKKLFGTKITNEKVWLRILDILKITNHEKYEYFKILTL